MRAFRRAEKRQTDHYFLVPRVRWKLKKFQRNVSKPMFDSTNLADQNVRQNCQQKLATKLEELPESGDTTKLKELGPPSRKLTQKLLRRFLDDVADEWKSR